MNDNPYAAEFEEKPKEVELVEEVESDERNPFVEGFLTGTVFGLLVAFVGFLVISWHVDTQHAKYRQEIRVQMENRHE